VNPDADNVSVEKRNNEIGELFIFYFSSSFVSKNSNEIAFGGFEV
jgi:hypothetical protein